MSDKSEKVIKRAKVYLKGAHTYTVGGVKFIKDVPKIVKGSEIAEFVANGYFRVVHLEPKVITKSKDEDDTKGSESSGKKQLKKSKLNKKRN